MAKAPTKKKAAGGTKIGGTALPTEVRRGRKATAPLVTAIDRYCGGAIKTSKVLGQQEDGTPILGPLEVTDVIAVTALTPHPRNPRQGDVGKIAELVRVNGFHGRVLVQVATPDGEPRPNLIVAGNHRTKAAAVRGYTHVPYEPVVCTDAEALQMLLADNKASDDATNDPAAVLAILEEFAAGADDREALDAALDGTGYDGDALDELEHLVHGSSDDGADDDASEPGAEQFLIVVTCRDESQQASLHDELKARGFPLKLVN